MKYSIILTLAMIAASTNSQAISINMDGTVDGLAATADLMPSSSGTFFDWSSPDLSPSSERDPATSVTDDALVTTFAFSTSAGAYVDLGFSAPVYDGEGDDLAFFMVGNTLDMDFSAIVSDDFGNSLSITNATSPFTFTWMGNLTVDGQAIALNMVLIDLDNYAAGGNAGDVFGSHALSNIRFSFGSEFGSPGLSLGGGLHDTAAVVPLPLPIVLFGSGLGLLGLLGRRKKA